MRARAKLRWPSHYAMQLCKTFGSDVDVVVTYCLHQRMDTLHVRSKLHEVTMADHPTTEMTTPDGDVVNIDTEIVPLIARLWKLGLKTLNSCQDNFGYVWIELFADDVERLLTIIAQSGNDFISERAREAFCLSPHDRDQLVTVYRRPADYWLLDVDPFSYDDEPEVRLSISLRFPREQLVQVETALAAIDG